MALTLSLWFRIRVRTAAVTHGGFATQVVAGLAWLAASWTPIPTGSRRSLRSRGWRGTGSLEGPQAEARPPAPLPGIRKSYGFFSPVVEGAGASTLKLQKNAKRFQKIRRQMEGPGAPPRTLTWEAIEQTRYLHKEFAESWSFPRLAEGFNVSTDVIRRVLKSKFIPTLEQKLKQDQKALIKAGLAPASGDAVKSLSAGRSVSGLQPPGAEVSSKSQTRSEHKCTEEPERKD
ncbi:Ngrn [Lemmus lemmus]